MVEVKLIIDRQSLLRLIELLGLSSQLTIWFLVVMFSVPPSIQPTENEMIIEGGNVTLTCNASGFPAPTVYWVKTDTGDRFNKTELVFANINRNKAGEYKCVANTPCNTSEELAEVDVKCKFIAIITIIMIF